MVMLTKSVFRIGSVDLSPQLITTAASTNRRSSTKSYASMRLSAGPLAIPARSSSKNARTVIRPYAAANRNYTPTRRVSKGTIGWAGSIVEPPYDGGIGDVPVSGEMMVDEVDEAVCNLNIEDFDGAYEVYDSDDRYSETIYEDDGLDTVHEVNEVEADVNDAVDKVTANTNDDNATTSSPLSSTRNSSWGYVDPESLVSLGDFYADANAIAPGSAPLSSATSALSSEPRDSKGNSQGNDEDSETTTRVVASGLWIGALQTMQEYEDEAFHKENKARKASEASRSIRSRASKTFSRRSFSTFSKGSSRRSSNAEGYVDEELKEVCKMAMMSASVLESRRNGLWEIGGYR
jgi:hypothetical protein